MSGKPIRGHEMGRSSTMKDCYFCKGKLIEQKVKVDFRWGQKLKIIENVPANVCQQCGEQYFQSGVYKAMEKLAASRKKPSSRLTVDVHRFKAAM
jgi:YgiT-type zinc finger domain-containing protein